MDPINIFDPKIFGPICFYKKSFLDPKVYLEPKLFKDLRLDPSLGRKKMYCSHISLELIFLLLKIRSNFWTKLLYLIQNI